MPTYLCLQNPLCLALADLRCRQSPPLAVPLPRIPSPSPLLSCVQISDALNRRRNRKGMRLRYAPSVYVDGLLVPRGSGIVVDATALELLGIRHVAEVCRDPPNQRREGG